MPYLMGFSGFYHKKEKGFYDIIKEKETEKTETEHGKTVFFCYDCECFGGIFGVGFRIHLFKNEQYWVFNI